MEKQDALNRLRKKANMNKSQVQSYIKHIPSENIKFQQFIDALFDSKMSKDDIKDEIIKYVSVLETNYNSKIIEMRGRVEFGKKKLIM